MMRFVAALLFLGFFSVRLVYATLTDDQALTRAQSVWGPNAHIYKYLDHRKGNKVFTYQVGCIDSVTGQFRIVGMANGSWDAAFQLVDLSKNGKHLISAVARDAVGNTQESEIVTVWACNP